MKWNCVSCIKFAESSWAGQWAEEGYLQKYFATLFFISDLSLLKVDALEANNEKTRKFYKNSDQYIFWLIVSYQTANFTGEGNESKVFKRV